MPVPLERSEQIIAAWRSGAADADGWENPAGPPLARYAESEITAAFAETRRPTACTGANTIPCC